jgi:hypothetical protein
MDVKKRMVTRRFIESRGSSWVGFIWEQICRADVDLNRTSNVPLGTATHQLHHIQLVGIGKIPVDSGSHQDINIGQSAMTEDKP